MAKSSLTLDEESKDYLEKVRKSVQHMSSLIDGLLRLSQVARRSLEKQAVDLSAMAVEVAEELRQAQPEREVEFSIEEGLVAEGDPPLIRVALENLMGNAWKFTARKRKAKIEFGSVLSKGVTEYFIRDNGAGFEAAKADLLFQPFQRLHSNDEFQGSGIGLATVKRIIHRHGGRIRAEGHAGKGAVFFFTLE